MKLLRESDYFNPPVFPPSPPVNAALSVVGHALSKSQEDAFEGQEEGLRCTLAGEEPQAVVVTCIPK